MLRHIGTNQVAILVRELPLGLAVLEREGRRYLDALWLYEEIDYPDELKVPDNQPI